MPKNLVVLLDRGTLARMTRELLRIRSSYYTGLVDKAVGEANPGKMSVGIEGKSQISVNCFGATYCNLRV